MAITKGTSIGTNFQVRGKAGTNRRAAGVKRRMFVQQFVKNGGNATQAAIAAGYAVRSAGVTGSRLLKDANVDKAIRQVEQHALARCGVTTERVLQEIMRIAILDIRKLYDVNGRPKPIHLLDQDTAAAISTLEVDEIPTKRGGSRASARMRVRVHDKVAALDRLMKHLGLYQKDNRRQGENLVIEIKVVEPPPRSGGLKTVSLSGSEP